MLATRDIRITTFAQADANFPRHSGPAMVERRDGSIFLAWIKMTPGPDPTIPSDDDAPADIASAVSRDGGHSWTDHRTLIACEPGDTSVYSPALLRLADGDILLRYERYHCFDKGKPRSISAYVCTSRDECATFSNATTIFERSIHYVGSAHDVRQLAGGRLIVPVMHATGDILGGAGGLIKAGCFYSDDGLAWQACDNFVSLPLRGALEPRIEQLRDGRLIMVMRTQLGSVFYAISEDEGRTWSDAQTTGLIAPESCPGMVRLPERGDLLLIWNNSPYDPAFDHFGKRSPLSVAISEDDGRTWGKVKHIETDPGWEFTNPSAMVTSPGTVLIAYEASKYVNPNPPGRLGRSRMHLKLAIVSLDWLYQ